MARVTPEYRVCSVDGCDRLLYARSWCRPHWSRHWRTGDLDLQVLERAWTAADHRRVMSLPTDKSGIRARRHTVTELAVILGRTRTALTTRRHKFRDKS